MLWKLGFVDPDRKPFLIMNRIASVIILIYIIGVESMSPGLVQQDCLECLCQVESDCKPKECGMDKGSLSCGFFQIKFPYWVDCYKHKPESGCGDDIDCWKKCALDKTCSSRCVQSYMARYKSQPGCQNDCESYVRLHNGGPRGCRNRGTDLQWVKVKKCLGKTEL